MTDPQRHPEFCKIPTKIFRKILPNFFEEICSFAMVTA